MIAMVALSQRDSPFMKKSGNERSVLQDRLNYTPIPLWNFRLVSLVNHRPPSGGVL